MKRRQWKKLLTKACNKTSLMGGLCLCGVGVKDKHKHRFFSHHQVLVGSEYETRCADCDGCRAFRETKEPSGFRYKRLTLSEFLRRK